MIQQFFEGIANTINRRPVLVAVLIAILFSVGLFGMSFLTMQTGWKTYMDQDSAKGVIESAYHRDYTTDTIILVVEAGDPLSPDVLNYIDNLEKDFRQQKNIGATLSVVDVLKSANGGEIPSSRVDTDRIVASLPGDVRALVHPSNVLTLVMIQLDKHLSDEDSKLTQNNIASIIDQSSVPAGVSVKISGTPAFSLQMKEALQNNMGILIGGAMILMVITMGLLFTYVRHRLLPVLIVAIGLVSALGLMGLVGISLNMAVIGAFPVLIGLGIDYAIQFHARFDEEARKGSLEDAVFMTVTKTGPAVMYAMLATSMGFLAMFISDVPMIRSFGLVSIIGIFACYWVSCIGIPTFALLLKYKPKQPKTEKCFAVGTDACDSIIDDKKNAGAGKNGKKKPFSYGDFLTNTSVKIAKNPIPILVIAACIAFIGFQIDPTIPVESNENTFVPQDMPAKINFDVVTRTIGSSSTADFLVQGTRVTDLDTVKWLAKFQDYELSHHDELTGSTSIVTYVLQYNNGIMPETQAELDAVMARIPADTRDLYLNGEMSSLVRFTNIKLEMPQTVSLKNRMIRDIAFLEPPTGITVNPAGDFETYTTLLTSMTNSKETMTGLGFLLVFVFLILVYRKPSAVSPIIPIIFVVGWNAVMLYILGITYNPLTATLGSMTIGVAAEYTILVMERYEEEKERLHDTVAAIQESVKKIGTAITVSGLATFFGFSALLLSTFPIISNFGVTTLIAVAFSLLSAIFIMPAVLSVMGQVSEWVGRRKRVDSPEVHA
ncbi:MAG TPA: hydrophobe/amphiphile efflux-3 (HAE3) family transporter [Methanoregulaceae archaeon]|nr:hydrophobe/amphiphile efflux-3 (HAE3) family transporter [Methanoregulaceae archaeon]